jgi:H+/Cl- antiporter ClcA
MSSTTRMLIYAFLTAIVGSLVVIPIMYTDPEFDIKTYHFWPQVAFGFFITSILVTLLAPHVFRLIYSRQ